MIGGFGNLKGEIDFWDLDNMKEISKSVSYCAVSTEFMPDGAHFMTAVLYERVKVDNEFRFISFKGGPPIKVYHGANQLNAALVKPSLTKYKKPDISSAVSVKFS